MEPFDPEQVQALAIRLDMQSIAIQELVRALSAAQAAQFLSALRLRTSALLAEREPLPSLADEAMATELGTLLRAAGAND